MLTETHLYREIHQQPVTLARFLEREDRALADLAAAIRARNVTHVVIAARGTSDNAGRYAQYVLGAHNGLPVGLTTPSLFTLYGTPPRLTDALVIGISQSGQSPDIVAVLAEGRRQGQLTVALTNELASPLAQSADFVVPLHAGSERAVAATKTYSAELIAIAALSAHLAQDDARLAQVRAVPDAVSAALALNDTIAAVAPRYRYMQQCVVIGRGYNYATAFEMALKLKELTYTVVEAYSSADFRHGPLALLEPGFPVVLLAPGGALAAEMADFARTARARGAELIVLSDEDALLALGRVALRLPSGVPEWLSPLTTIVPGQLLALHLAHTRDYDVDAPRGIRKVTETT